MRWKISRKSKGAFYQAIREEMQQLHDSAGDLGCRTYALAAGALNQAITLANDQRLTRQQYVMFALADMAAHVEIGASLARKAAGCAQRGDSDAEKMKIIARLFAAEVSRIVCQNILQIVRGCGQFDEKATAEFMAQVAYTELTAGVHNMIPDMDQLADIVFER
jgi:alkylation response protein AidB-like acyl-CoA dehydrogenase